MENAKTSKKRKLVKTLVFTSIPAVVLGGCVVSLNIQKNNNNSEQRVKQSEKADLENDSTTINLKLK